MGYRVLGLGFVGYRVEGLKLRVLGPISGSKYQ